LPLGLFDPGALSNPLSRHSLKLAHLLRIMVCRFLPRGAAQLEKRMHELEAAASALLSKGRKRVGLSLGETAAAARSADEDQTLQVSPCFHFLFCVVVLLCVSHVTNNGFEFTRFLPLIRVLLCVIL
jgi:hypothetical protein